MTELARVKAWLDGAWRALRARLQDAGRGVQSASAELGTSARAARRRARPALARARRRIEDGGAGMASSADAARARARPLALATRRQLRRANRTLLATLLGAVAAFGLCFVVVADAMKASSPTRPAEHVQSDATRVKVALGPAPALKVAAAVLAPVAPVRNSAASRTPPVEEQPPAEQTQTTTQTEPEQQTQQQPTQTAKPKPKPKPKATPKPSGPDFDDTGPQGP